MVVGVVGRVLWILWKAGYLDYIGLEQCLMVRIIHPTVIYLSLILVVIVTVIY